MANAKEDLKLKINRKQTVYVGFEVVGSSQGKASGRALELLRTLNSEGLIENFELFAVDDRPLKETKKIISLVMFEIFKLKNFTVKVYGVIEPYILFISNIGNIIKDKNKK